MTERLFHKIALVAILPTSALIAYSLAVWWQSTSFEAVCLLLVTYLGVTFLAAVLEELISRREQRRLETRRRLPARRR